MPETLAAQARLDFPTTSVIIPAQRMCQLVMIMIFSKLLRFLVAVLLSSTTVTPSLCAEPAGSSAKPIPVSELGAEANVQYQGDGLSVEPTPGSARLRCVFQKLEGQVTGEGLWLVSTAEPQVGEKFRVVASAVGREAAMMALPAQGVVTMADKLARYARPGLTEEYSVSMNGVRQDFVVAQRPAGTGELSVELTVTGAKASELVNGARLVLDGSGRKLAYNRLQAVDAAGNPLAARMTVTAANRLAVWVQDAAAIYPVRIDPTFSDADWISMGGLPGANLIVWAMAADDSGNLFIGGDFTVVGDVLANRVAKWDGQVWSALGEGVNGKVSSLAVSGTNLFAGGTFTMAGGRVTFNVAKWNGSAWSDLGAGTDGEVKALAISGTNLYAGGNFMYAGEMSAKYMAKWNESGWSPLGAGMDSTVYALAVSGTNLYAGGSFTTAGAMFAKGVAKWDGNAWAPVGPGLGSLGSETVYALAVSGSNLYAAGGNGPASGSRTIYVAKWNGSEWASLGTGLATVPVLDSPPIAYALAVSGTNLYVGGHFTTAGGNSATNVARWDGSVWSPLGTGVDGAELPGRDVCALAVSGSSLFVGGDLGMAGGYDAERLAKWNGSEWSVLGSGVGGEVYALAVSGSDLYLGGRFTTVGGIKANRVAKWNGSVWSPLGAGVDGEYPSVVRTLAVSGSDLYVGGEFNSVGGGYIANSVAKWNGSTWSALGSGVGGMVYALAVSGTNLYAGGYFNLAGGTWVYHIARWNGSTWSALGTGMNHAVYALAVSGNDLYAGGDFTNAGGILANHVAKWNGNTWSALGTGVDGGVPALLVSGANLYVGGYFTTAGGVSANCVVKWDGSGWSALGAGVHGGVQTMAISGADLYVGGNFSMAGGSSANGVAKWDGSTWSALGSGVSSGSVNALAVGGDDLFVGGSFLTAGGKVSARLAKANLGGSGPPPPAFSSIVVNPYGTQMLLTFTSDPLASFYLLSSTNLITWKTNSTVNASGPATWILINVASPHEFFRLHSIP